jgi:hypothetical protein
MENLRDLDMDERTMLKWELKKCDVECEPNWTDSGQY